MKYKPVVISTFTVLVVVCLGVWLSKSLPAATSIPTVGALTATPAIITVSTPATVTFTVSLTDPTLTPGGVNLLRLSATGAQSTILGVMHDDGLKGDAVAGDHVYTLQVPFSEATAGQVQLQVSAAFKGQLKRVLSPIAVVQIGSVLSVSGPVVYSLTIPVGGTAAVQPTIVNIFPKNKSFDQSHEYAGDVLVFVDSNPTNLSAADYYNGTIGVDLYSGSPTILPLTVSGHAAAKYLQSTGLVGAETVVVVLPNRFLRLENRGDEGQFNSILQSLSVQ
jgi:hypothetical protein